MDLLDENCHETLEGMNYVALRFRQPLNCEFVEIVVVRRCARSRQEQSLCVCWCGLYVVVVIDGVIIGGCHATGGLPE